MDVIASHIPSVPKDETFTVAQLTVNTMNKAFFTLAHDSPATKIYASQSICYTDFPLDEYTRSNAFKVKGADGKSTDYHASADLSGQADHLGATIKADIIKQKLPVNNGGYAALNTGGSAYGKWDKRVYTNLCGSKEDGTGGHPIDLCRYQILNNFMGRVPLINSGGESKGADDTAEAVTTAVIYKRAGGMGLISGRKASRGR